MDSVPEHFTWKPTKKGKAKYFPDHIDLLHPSQILTRLWYNMLCIAMIEKVLYFLRTQLDHYLSLRTSQGEKIVLSDLTDKDGKVIVNGLAMTLVNIEEERMMRNQPHFKETPHGTVAKVNPEVVINLYVLFTANFGDDEVSYRESLKFISHIISFFQARNFFTPENYPGLDEKVKKLTADLHSLSLEQQNHLWGSLGTRYMTSVMYKLKVISIQEDEIRAEAPPIIKANLK